MRVVGGKARGCKLEPVPGDTTRPILDRVKTALFDILRPEISGLEVLDAFAGSGGVGIEALSQGAASCVFLDLSPKAVETIRANLKRARLEDQAEVRQSDAFAYLRKTERAFDLIYIAPPQYRGMWIEAMRNIAERPSLLKENGLVIAQIDPSEYEAFLSSTLAERRQAKYGNTVLVFYRKT